MEETTPKRKKSKKALILIILIAAVAIAVTIFLIIKFNNPEKRKQEELTAHMETLGSDFYTETLFKQLEESRSEAEIKDFLQKHEETGISVSLDNLIRTASEENKTKLEDFTYKDEDCDKDATKALIFPQAPFGRDDYRIEVRLECGFTSPE